MSRSHKHTPITGITTAESEKDDKRMANRRERARNRQRVRQGMEPMDRRLFGNPWDFAKDGKQYVPEWHEYMRK